MRYHEGEVAIQARAGVRETAEKVSRIIGDSIPAVAAVFLAERSFIVTSTTAADGAVTASLLGGDPGFAIAAGPHTIRIESTTGHTAGVRRDLASHSAIGLLAVDFATRRRLRANGSAVLDAGAIVITTSEVYSNCPQYIHPREVMPLVRNPRPRASAVLAADQRALIATADTLFIATAHPERGADASHRGGEPGFVEIVSPARLRWLDYRGNNMFNTLGNLAVNPRAGLLFVDFATGRTLQLKGRATVEWNASERAVEFDVDEVLDAR